MLAFRTMITMKYAILTFLLIIVGFSGCSLRDDRTPLVRGLWVELNNYARDHNDWFPQSDKGAFAALQKLYPDYDTASGKELAGLSVDIDLTVNALKAAEQLSEKTSSWIYVPGFRSDDPENFALLWERKPGISSNGAVDPSGGHSVLLLSGVIVQIPGTNWTTYLQTQEARRKELFSGRKAKAESP